MPLMSLRQPKSLGLCLGLCRAVPSRTQTLLGEMARHWGGGAAGAPLPRASRVTRSSHLEAPPSTCLASQSHASGARSPQGPRDVSAAPALLAVGMRDAAPTHAARGCLQSRETEARRWLWQRESLAELLHSHCSTSQLCPIHLPSAMSEPQPMPQGQPSPPQTSCPGPACRTHGDGQGSDGTPGCLVGIPKGDALRGHWHGVQGDGLMAGGGV